MKMRCSGCYGHKHISINEARVFVSMKGKIKTISDSLPSL